MTHDLLQFIQRSQKISPDYLQNNDNGFKLIKNNEIEKKNNEKNDTMTHLTACMLLEIILNWYISCNISKKYILLMIWLTCDSLSFYAHVHICSPSYTDEK